MTWVRLDDQFPEHKKIATAGPVALALQVAGLCYCNRNLTDGFIPFGVAHRLISTAIIDETGRKLELAMISGMAGFDSGDVIEMSIDALITNGVWDEVAGGYEIHDYDEYQPSKAQVLAEREAAAERKRRSRGRKKAVTDDVTQVVTDASQRDSLSDSAVSHTTPVPVPQPEPEKAEAEESLLSADRSETTRNDLPIEKEQLTVELLSVIGDHADDKTPDVVRALTKRVPPASIVKVIESSRTQKPKNRAAYAVGALQSEFAELATRRSVASVA